MGWDMYAVTRQGKPPLNLDAFKIASDAVVSETGTVDGTLESGYLNCSDCAAAIEAITGHSAWQDWSADELKKRFALALMPDNIEQDKKWAYHSAYQFLRVCAEGGLAAEASY